MKASRDEFAWPQTGRSGSAGRHSSLFFSPSFFLLAGAPSSRIHSKHGTHFYCQAIEHCKDLGSIPPRMVSHLGVITFRFLPSSTGLFATSSISLLFFLCGGNIAWTGGHPPPENLASHNLGGFLLRGHCIFTQKCTGHQIRQAIIVFLKPPCTLTWHKAYTLSLPRLEAILKDQIDGWSVLFHYIVQFDEQTC